MPNPILAKTFDKIFKKKLWGNGESVSGPGSSLSQAAVVSRELERWIAANGVKSLVDAPCGDALWVMALSLSDAKYIGCDIVSGLIQHNRTKYPDHNWLIRDITSDILPTADVILCRDCFIHLSTKHIQMAVANFQKSGFQYLLSTTFPQTGDNRDITSGGYRPINLEDPVYGLGCCVEYLRDASDDLKHADKKLGVWIL